MAKAARKSAWPLLAGVLLAVAATIGALMWMSGGDRRGGEGEKPLIGGNFELLDQNGKPFTDADLRGRYSLIYFGYANCPDVCPTTLQAMTEALEMLGPLTAKIRPVMISVDPERDTPQALKEYLENFHPSFIGLTGTPEQVRQAAQAFRVFYRRVKGVEGGSGDYLMDHSSIIYLMDPEGRYLDHFPSSVTADRLAKGVREAILRHEKGSS